MQNPSSLPDQVMALVATERAIEEGLGRRADLTSTHTTLHASLEAIQGQAGIQRQVLENYLRQGAAEPTEPRSPIAPLLAEPSSPPMLSNLLAAYCAAFSFAANEYSVLLALGLHLYDPAVREIARKHLSSYATAVRLLTHLLPGAVVEEGEELPPTRRDSQFKLLRWLLRTEHSRLHFSAVFEPQQTAVLGV